jgi:hypothetical protein
MRATLTNVARVVTQVQQRVERTIRYDENVAAASAITTGWTTARYKLFASKSRDAVTTITSLHVNLRTVDKHLN